MSEAPIGKKGTGNAGATITPGKPSKKSTYYWVIGIVVVVIIIVVLAIAL